jgi:two-component system, NtrC family, response regulator GlrR
MEAITRTASDGELPIVLDGPDLITAIRAFGHAAELPLPTRQAVFSVGTSLACDIRIDSEYVSSMHCVLERHGHRLRVQDQGSRNGTFFRGRRESVFDIAPGDTFAMATTTLLALNDQMRDARPMIGEVLGFDDELGIDEVLVRAVQDGPLLVVGEKGTGLPRFARVIHEVSLRRDHPFVEAPVVPATRQEQEQIIAGARRGTLVVGTASPQQLRPFLEMVLGPGSETRLILLVPTIDLALRSIVGEGIFSITKIEIRPLRKRKKDFEDLVTKLFIEARVRVRMTDLTIENRAALRAHKWPDNLEELRHAIESLAAIIRAGSIRKAASVLKVPRSTLQYGVERLGLTLPLLASDQLAEHLRSPSEA